MQFVETNELRIVLIGKNCYMICYSRKYVKGVHKNNTVVNVKKCTLYVFVFVFFRKV